MTKLSDKVKTALDETRMLILGVQILVGFQFRTVFEDGFDQLPGDTPSDRISRRRLDKLLMNGDPEAAGLVHCFWLT